MKRRRFLTTGAPIVGVSIAGCASVFDDTEEFTRASLYEQRIQVWWEDRGISDTTHFTYIMRLTRDEEALVGHVATELEDSVRSSTDIRVDDEVREHWRNEFEDVRYILLVDLGDDEGLGSKYGVSYDLFNDIQFDDSLHVRRSSSDIEILDQEEGGRSAPTADDILWNDFADIHGDSNPPSLHPTE